MCYTQDVEREKIKNNFRTANKFFRCTEQTKGVIYMKESKEKFVKLLDFYDRLDPKEKANFEKLLDSKVKELQERDAQNEQQ